jgi:LPXTG-motif cell wall-anchored protein
VSGGGSGSSPATAAPVQYEAPAAPGQEAAPVQQYEAPLPATGGISPVVLASVVLASLIVISLVALRRKA